MDKIDATISNPAEISDFAPKFKMMEVNPEKIRVLIGPGGKNIKAIIDETGSDVEIQDSGIVNIFAPDGPTLEKTIELINSYVKDPEVGEVYEGVVKDIKEFGAFVEILPGVEGLCHISELAYKRVMNVEEILKIGDTVKVKIIDNRGGKYSLSRKALLEKPDDYVEEEGNNRRERKSRNNNHNNNRRRY